jgi:hypothetical protein
VCVLNGEVSSCKRYVQGGSAVSILKPNLAVDTLIKDLS